MKSLYTVYENVVLMMTKYRELTLEAPKMTFSEFADSMNFNRYTIIKAKCGADNIRGATHNTTIIIDRNSDYANKSHNFKTLFERLQLKYYNEAGSKIINDANSKSPNEANSKAAHEASVKQTSMQYLTNVCVISEYDLTSYIDKYIAGVKKDNPTLYFESYLYDIFNIDLFKHISVPKHTIVTTAADELFYNYFTSKYNIPYINHTDASAAWIGARPGMIIEEKHLSETAVYSTTYLICTAGKAKKIEDEDID